MRRHTTPTGDKAKAIIKKIDRWVLKQEDECTLDWSYQDLVGEFEKLYASMQQLDKERAEEDRREAADRAEAAA